MNGEQELDISPNGYYNLSDIPQIYNPKGNFKMREMMVIPDFFSLDFYFPKNESPKYVKLTVAKPMPKLVSYDPLDENKVESKEGLKWYTFDEQ